MKPEELRIGNWVERKALILGETEKYYRVSARDIMDAENYNERWSSQDIPLTPEWLERFGFEKETHSASGIAIWSEYTRNEVTLFMDGEWPHTKELFYSDQRIKIKYVHQLQNLYYALTGEELR